MAAGPYQPNWPSLDSRPLPPWFDEAKVGIFLHWGVYSVPSWGTTGGAAGEWYWWRWQGEHNPAYEAFHNRTYGPNFTYQEFGPMFTAELFNATEWAEIFADAGIKYVVLTSKHHEGFANWDNGEQAWGWNSVDVGPHRDLVGELGDAVRAANITFGTYFSLFEWFNPLYLADKANNFTTSKYVDEIMLPQVKDLVTKHQPELIWADGDWEANSTFWKSPEFLAWLYNESPVKDTVIVNDRWGSDCSLKHGGYYSGGDRFTPGKLLAHKWEDAFTIDRSSWGFRRNGVLSDYLTVEDIVSTVIETVAFGGNALINVGPTHDGRIANIFADRLHGLGSFLRVNGEAIYGTQPWTTAQNQSSINAFYTTKGKTLYCLVSPWPAKTSLTMEAVKCPSSSGCAASLVGPGTVLQASFSGAGTTVTLPSLLALGSQLDTSAIVVKLTGFL